MQAEAHGKQQQEAHRVNSSSLEAGCAREQSRYPIRTTWNPLL
jgi:hypothetical protein